MPVDSDLRPFPEVPVFTQDQFAAEQAEKQAKAKLIPGAYYEYYPENLLVVRSEELGITREFQTWFPVGENKTRHFRGPHGSGFDARARIQIFGKPGQHYVGYIHIAGETHQRDLLGDLEEKQQIKVMPAATGGKVTTGYFSLSPTQKLQIIYVNSELDTVDVIDRDHPHPKALLERKSDESSQQKVLVIGENTCVVEDNNGETFLTISKHGAPLYEFQIPNLADIPSKLNELVGDRLLADPQQGPTSQDDRWHQADLLKMVTNKYDIHPRQSSRHVVKLAS